MIKKCLIFILLISSVVYIQAQAFLAGDIIINANYGAPQITPVILKTALNIYNKNTSNKDFTFSIKNSGVINAKLEYAMMESFGLGFASSYWNMSVAMHNNYQDKNPLTGISETYSDTYQLTLTALALGIRGNYHLVGELKAKTLDPYFGLTLGLTKFSKDLSFSTTFPDKKTPEIYDFFKTGFASRLLKVEYSSYVSTTAGIRWFPVKYFGINIEAGWDRGAFLFAGIVVKFHTKPIKAFND